MSPVTPTVPVLCFLCKGLALGRKILRHARKTHATLHPPEEPDGGDFQPDVNQLFRPVDERPASSSEEPEESDSQPGVPLLLGSLDERSDCVQEECSAAVSRLAPTCSLQCLDTECPEV